MQSLLQNINFTGKPGQRMLAKLVSEGGSRRIFERLFTRTVSLPALPLVAGDCRSTC